MNKWNGKRFSIYDKEEKQVLGLLNNLGEQTNFNTDEVERLTISNNKKVSHEEMKNKYKIDDNANFTGSWHGLKRPTQSNEGLASTVEQIIDETIPGINSQMEQIKDVDRKIIYNSIATRKKYKRPKNYGVVTFIDDDGTKAAYNWFKPLLEKYSIKGGFAIISDKIDNDVNCFTSADILKTKADGHDILSHSTSHVYWDTIDNTTLDYECRKSKEVLENLLKDSVNMMVYPGGGLTYPEYEENSFNDNVRKKQIVSKYYDFGFITSEKVLKRPLDPHAIPRTFMGSYNEGENLAKYKVQIDDTVKKKDWLVFCLHSAQTPTEKKALVEQVIQYCITKENLLILPPSQAIEYFDSNFLQVGLNYIGVDNDGFYTQKGKIFENIQNNGYDIVSGVTSPNDYNFPTYCKSIHRITANNATSSGLPLPTNGGVLETEKFTDNFMQCKQKWKPNSSLREYVRYATSETTWSDFRVSTYLLADSYTKAFNTEPITLNANESKEFLYNVGFTLPNATSVMIVPRTEYGGKIDLYLNLMAYVLDGQLYFKINNLANASRTLSTQITFRFING